MPDTSKFETHHRGLATVSPPLVERAGVLLNAAILIAKLLLIENAIERVHPLTLRSMVLEVEGCVLEMEQEMIETLRENGRLHERLEKCEEHGRTHSFSLSSYSELAADLSRERGRKPAASEPGRPLSLVPTAGHKSLDH